MNVGRSRDGETEIYGEVDRQMDKCGKVKYHNITGVITSDNPNNGCKSTATLTRVAPSTHTGLRFKVI